MGAQHAGAGAAGRHHMVEALEQIDHLAGDGLGGLAVAGIIGRLAAAGLSAGASTRQPASSSSLAAARPTLGRKRSTRQVTKSPTRMGKPATPMEGLQDGERAA